MLLKEYAIKWWFVIQPLLNNVSALPGKHNRESPKLCLFALGAQRPIVVKLSRERSVGRSVRPSVCRTVQCMLKNRRIGSGCRLASLVGRVQGWGRWWGLAIGPREGVLFGANLGRAIVFNGNFTAYVCDSAAKRPSSQIILCKFVCKVFVFLKVSGSLALFAELHDVNIVTTSLGIK